MRHHKAIAVISFLSCILVFSQASMGQGTLVQTIDASAFTPPSPDTSGVIWLQHITGPNSILSADSEVNEIPALFTGENLFEIDFVPPALTRTGTTCDPGSGTYSCEPTGLAYDPATQFMFVTDDNRDRIFTISPGPDGLYGSGDDVIENQPRIDGDEYPPMPGVPGSGGIEDAEGITYCPDDGRLYLVGGIDSEVYIFDPGADGEFNGIAPAGDDIVTQFDTTSFGLNDVEGIACDVDHTVALGFSADHLYLSGDPDDTIFHVTTDGTVVRTFTVLAAAKKLAGLTLAPSSLGGTDPNPTLLNLYIADRGVDNDIDPTENDGKIYEYSITGLTAPNNPPDVDAGVMQTITATPPVVANVDGTVDDDGLPIPPGMVTTTWSLQSGPGATFAAPNELDTTVTLDAVGIYKLRLTAFDGEPCPLCFDEVTIEVKAPGGISTVYISTSGTGDAPGGVHIHDDDIVAYDVATGTWSIYFDGHDEGLGASGQDVNAFHIDTDGSILLSIKAAATLPGVGLVERADIVRFVPTAGTFEMVLDGSDVELGDSSGERIDAIGILPDGRFVISSTGSGSALGVNFKDEDLLAFNDTQLGPDTMGTWERYFDGSDVELSGGSKDVNGTWVDDNGDIYLTVRKLWSVTGASGDGQDIFVCTPGSLGSSTSCTYQFFWDGQGNGLTGGGNTIDGISLSR